MNEPRKQLLSLGLSDSEVTIYLAMVSGARVARDLVKVTGLKRPTVYYALGCLEKRGLISKTGMEGDKRFSLESSKRLLTIAEEKVREAEKLKKEMSELVPTFDLVGSSEDRKPTVAFFEGVEAVKNVIRDMLYCKGKKINSVVPDNNFFWQVGREFVQSYVEERIKRGITTRNLWNASIDKKTFEEYYEGHSDVRIVPDIMQGAFKTTVFLYDDKTLFVSSIKNSYCVLITSKEYHDTMQAWFEGLWSASTPHGQELT